MQCFFSSRRRHTRCALVTGVQTCALPIFHRAGLIAPGEPIVFVATASRHRRAAFEAADYLMDRLKTEAVFWKREEHDGTSTWIEQIGRESCRERVCRYV